MDDNDHKPSDRKGPGDGDSNQTGVLKVVIVVGLILAIVGSIIIAGPLIAKASPSEPKFAITDKDATVWGLGLSSFVTISFTAENSGKVGGNLTVLCSVHTPDGEEFTETKRLYLDAGESKHYSVRVTADHFDTDLYWTYDCVIYFAEA